ncbi:GNAT family N-acetyltransferase [Sandaracinobacteroides saxicola]|uniref:GNAT family N-acetyltransferase n=1 Tax=Sandaracinobacteroides saxicola TaxID=2759707 RepID=A0A7G5IF38_9SPHN|nr:GNAT family N-acetyltransferase [Sandaracinobacteroides saxicola]QMW21980.1 GNAT family N-acetyltransferase [Sandaracinobacteroides saxicola]
MHRPPARIATDTDRAAALALLTAAFQSDPAMTYIWPDAASRARRLPALFAAIWDDDHAQGGTAFVTAGGEAATLWLPPGHQPLSLAAVLPRLPLFIRLLGGGFFRALANTQAMERHRPRYPHHYLHFAGCHPTHQGKGHGGRAIRAGLARADADGLPAYLETATPTNVPLYESLGFRTLHQWTVGQTLPFWGMQRPASP